MQHRTVKLATFLALGLFAAGEALAQSCTDEVGAEDAQVYVDQCIEVSPATRPPCNAENPCQMIWSEVWRGCDMLGEDRPAFCADYCEMVDYDTNDNPPVYCGG